MDELETRGAAAAPAAAPAAAVWGVSTECTLIPRLSGLD